MKLKNIKILFLSDKDNVYDYSIMSLLTKVVNEEQGSMDVLKYEEIDELIANIADKKYDIIIFDTKDSINAARRIKNVYNNFAAILYTEEYLPDILTITMYNKFDAYIDPETIGCWATNGCEFSSRRVTSVLLCAIKIHKLKYKSILNAIDKFVTLIEHKQEYTLFNIIDASGKLIAVDSNVERLFGHITGHNVKDLPHIYGDAAEVTDKFTVLNKGDELKLKTKNGDFIRLRLLEQWVFENGQTFYIQMWENVEELEHIQRNIESLDNISKQLKNITRIDRG